MGSGDTPRGADFTVGALNMASEINGGTLLTRPEGHDTAAGKTPRKAKTTASQNSRPAVNEYPKEHDMHVLKRLKPRGASAGSCSRQTGSHRL